MERPRAALLVVSLHPEDQSRLSLGSTLRFLEALRVPVLVWAPRPESLAPLNPGDTRRAFFGAQGMVELFQTMTATLAAQHVVWVEGEHLPAEIVRGEKAPEWLGLAE